MGKWGGHGTAHFRKAAYGRGEEGKATKEEFKKRCLCRRDVIGKAKAQLELRFGRDVKGSRKSFYHDIGSKRRNKENVRLLLTDGVGVI